jgi:hypothetical protein
MVRGGNILLVSALFVGAYWLGTTQDAAKPIAPQAFIQAPPPMISVAPVQKPQAPSKAKPTSLPESRQPLSLAPPQSVSLTAPPQAVDQPNATPKLTPKQKAEAALTAAAIAALIVAASRQAYYATGRPCACPDDRMRNGRACGSRSAYSRPGGAQPLCSASDVSAKMIEEYRSKIARR